jgi:hypothetical protein
MGFKRGMVLDGQLARGMRAGDGFTDNPNLVISAADAAYTVTVADIANGIFVATSLSAGRVFTTPTAALILAAFSELDVGDNIHFKVSSIAAFAITWAAGTGVTLVGRATTPASSSTDIYITKTAATTVKWTVL